jgi:hypothetical protein
MAAESETRTTADYIVTALSPLLIMLMVGSLVFFLVEVLYEGKYSGRLLYTLFFFVLGAVLVARIAIEKDSAQASGYGLALGIVTYIAILSYVDYPGGGWLKTFGWLVNLGLLLLIWWSAHKLTWDCTHIDEKRKGAGRGLLSAAGLDVDARETADGKPPDPEAAKPAKKASPDRPERRKKRAKGKHDSRLWDWIEQYKKHREAQRNGPHTPGVWVIYFALAALPLFALGQSLVRPEDEERRQATFLQMAVYVGSALALLATTSYLGLRRYLRQRKAKMPAAMTASWLGFGAVLIAAFLILGAFLPRPHSEVPWFGISRAGKSDREASRHAVNRDAAGTGDGARGNVTKAGDSGPRGRKGEPGASGRGQKGGGGSGDKGKGRSDQSNKSGNQSESRDSKSGGEDSKDGKSNEGGERDEDRDNERTGETDREEDEAKDKAEGRDGSSRDTSSSPQLGAMFSQLSSLLKWIVFAIVAILVVAGLALAILRYLAPFTQWAQRLLDALRDWWAGLFTGKRGAAKAAAAAETPTGPVRPPPFYEFSNPFGDGSADGRDLAELVEYTFQALDSWAWDRECGREPRETPLEFCARLGEAFPDLTEVLTRFARTHARTTYSDLPPPSDALAVLEATWEGMVHGVAVVG